MGPPLGFNTKGINLARSSVPASWLTDWLMFSCRALIQSLLRWCADAHPNGRTQASERVTAPASQPVRQQASQLRKLELNPINNGRELSFVRSLARTLARCVGMEITVCSTYWRGWR